MTAHRRCGRPPPDRLRSWLLLASGLLLLCAWVVRGQDCSPSSTVSTCFANQRNALESFYNTLGGPTWRSNTNWLSTSIPGQHCAWKGIYCCDCPDLGSSGTFLPDCSIPCSVIGIDLPNNNLAGAIADVDATAVWQQLTTTHFINLQGMKSPIVMLFCLCP